MSLKITLMEEPRVFGVFVGEKEVGKVTSYKEKGYENQESYSAELNIPEDDKGQTSKWLGDFATLEEAGLKVVEYHYGPAKIFKITERLV